MKEDMKQIIFYILLMGLIGCSTNNQKNRTVEKESEEKLEIETSKKKLDYREIVLSENTLDTFLIPFPETNMLMRLRNYYKPYQVEVSIGQQDGPDFTYIRILEDDKKPIAYLNFDP